MIEKADIPTREQTNTFEAGNNGQIEGVYSGSIFVPDKPVTHRTLSRRRFIGVLAGAMGFAAYGAKAEPALADGGLGSGGTLPDSPSEPKPSIPNSFHPEIEPTEYGVDPVSRSEIERRKEHILPVRWRESYDGKVGREESAQAYFEEVLAIAMGYEGGGLATDARELNEKTSSQYSPKNNTPNGFIKTRDFGSQGISQIFVVAPGELSLVRLDTTPISLIRGVEKLITDDGREIFSFNNGVVIGKPSEIDPKDLAKLVQSVTYVNEGINWGNKMLEKKLIKNPGVTIDELIRMVKDANSEFNLDVKSLALKAALETAHALQTASPDYWNINPGFAATLEGYREALNEGELKVLEYTRSKSLA